MATSSELTLGNKLANASSLLKHLKSFSAYAPSDPELEAPALDGLIEQIRTQNEDIAGNLQAYSAAVDIRQKLFEKDTNSLRKIVSLVAATVRSSYGKTSKEAADISSLVIKIRGVSVPKKDKDAKPKTVSQSERSFGSMTQNFNDVIKTLENYGSKYNPANTDLTTVNLRSKLKSILEASDGVTGTYGQLKEGRDERSVSYKTLTAKTQRIKDAVKGQYGPNSTEYNLIRSLGI